MGIKLSDRTQLRVGGVELPYNPEETYIVFTNE
ncbi:hypothetical protein QFZ96_002063 [Paraburkholderia youngii]